MSRTALGRVAREVLPICQIYLEDVVHVQIPRLGDDRHAPRAGRDERLQLLVLRTSLELAPRAVV